MDDSSERHLERTIHEALAQLPEIQAPATLIPRVRLAIQQRAHKPWWRQSWAAWPLTLRAVSLVSLLGLVGCVFYGGNWAWQEYASRALSEGWQTAWSMIASVGTLAGTLGRATLLVGRSVSQVWLIAGAGVVVMMYLACVGIGVVCFQVATPKR